MTKHLVDLLTILIQLSSAPLVKPNPETHVKQTSSNFVMTEDLYKTFIEDQSFYQRKLQNVAQNHYQPSLVRALMTVQAGTNQRRPKWFQNACGKLLSDCVMRPHGVTNVIQGLLDIGAGLTSNHHQTKTNEMIANVLASPPFTKHDDIDAYYAHVCPQILAILRLPNGSEAQMFQQTACQAIRVISEKSLINSRRYLFEVAMEPLLTFTNNQDCSKGWPYITIHASKSDS